MGLLRSLLGSEKKLHGYGVRMRSFRHGVVVEDGGLTRQQAIDRAMELQPPASLPESIRGGQGMPTAVNNPNPQ